MPDTMKPWPSLAPYGKSVSMSGGTLFYYDSAQDNDPLTNRQTILLIHGLGDEADTWRHIFPLLVQAGYRVLALDLPGFGRSQWKGWISMRCHCRAVLRVMAEAAASTERPVTLVGSSLGAGIAEMVAGRQPELVKSLVLIDGCFPFAGSIDRGLLLVGLPFVGKNWYRSFRTNHEAAWKSLYPYYSDLDALSVEDKDFLRQRVIARVESSNQERGYFATLRSMAAVFQFSKRALTRKIQAYPGKILVLWGEGDTVLPQGKADLFRSLRMDADFAIIANAGHLPHQEKPDATAAEIVRFLS
jgi:pimeloyl-ACP methyl ester carboxylesterase